MSISPIPLPSRTHSRASSRTSFLLRSARPSSEYPTDLNTERVSLQEHHSVHVGASEEALLNRCSWLAPLDNMLSDGTREPWKTPFAPAAPHDKHYVSQPLTSACFAMPPLPITGFEDQTVLDRDPAFEVTWAGDGSDMPRNWPAWYRGSILACVSFATLVVIMASTAYSPGIPGMMATFGIENRIVPILGVTTYLLGLALGPLILAPLSEIYGRRPVYIVSLFLFAVFMVPGAVARNFATILVTRFFAAFAGSVVMAGAPGTLNDICDDETRTRYLSVWILGAVNGPVIGPVFAGIIFQYAGWRWIGWWLVILAFVACALMAAIQETHGDTILRTRCKLLRTVDGRFWTRAGSGDSLPVKDRLRASLRQPVVMIFTEPICTFWDIYVGSVYAILYLCIVGYPIVFTQMRGWSPAVANLPFLSIGLGSCLTVAAEPTVRRLTKRLSSQAPSSVDPTLLILLGGGALLPISQLLFAVSAAPPNAPVVAILAGIPLGAGNMLVFLYATDYLATTYKAHAASALAGYASMRYLGAALLPLLAPVMYGRLGALVSGLVLVAVLTVLAVVPVVFIKWGAALRARSQMAHGGDMCTVKGCKST